MNPNSTTNIAKYVVDTHALLWHVQADPRLGRNAKVVLDDPNSVLLLPLIALAEACWVVEAGRTSIASVHDLLTAVDADSRIEIVSFDRAILDVSLTLTSINEMHDRQIAALVVLEQNQGASVALLTKDGNITASKLVPIIW